MNKKVKVLVVDDNIINRKIAANFLECYGLEIAEAESGVEAVAMVSQAQYDLVFMDYMMPEMDGLEATRIIRRDCGENGRKPVIVALTASVTEEVSDIFLQNGFQDFLLKPLDIEPLERILKRWVLEDVGEMKPVDCDKAGMTTQKEAGFEDINIPGIDIEEAKKYHSGSVEDYLELLELYSLDGKRKLPFLAGLLEKEDYRNYEIEVHGLKSASAKLGAKKLSAQAREHEIAAEKGNVDFIRRHYAELFLDYETLLNEINIFIEQHRSAGERETGEENSPIYIDSATLLQEVMSALEQVENFQSRECAKKVDGLLRYQLENDIKERLMSIREQLKMYEDDEAERLLRDLATQLDKGGK